MQRWNLKNHIHRIKIFKFLGNLTILLIILFGAKDMNHKQPFEKKSRHSKPYWILFIAQAVIMLIIHLSIILQTDFSKCILRAFVNEIDQLKPDILSQFGPPVLLGILCAGWITVLNKSKNMNEAQFDSTVTWLLGTYSASLFSVATWSISALGAENANLKLWYLAIITIIWTVISSTAFIVHKIALFDKGKGL